MPAKSDGHGTQSNEERIKQSAAASVRMLVYLTDEVRSVQNDPVSAALTCDAIESIYEVSGIGQVSQSSKGTY